MWKFLSGISVCLVLLLMLGGTPAFCADQVPTGFARWIELFKIDAAAAGISRRTLDEALHDVRYLPGVIAADRRQPEFKISLDEYLAGALNEERVARGQRLLHKYWNQLHRIAGKYRVQPHYLVALWGIESDYGRHSGKVPLLSALATLAFDARRSEYFRGELLNALRILDSGKLPRGQLRGSWAGAMGQLQFMPSTFLGFAVDGDGDGRIDLWQTRADYLASAANYLHRSGWQWRQKWGRQVKMPRLLADSLTGLDVSAPLRIWQQRGVRLSQGYDLPQANFTASLVLPEGREGKAFLVYDNYRVLLKWNRAHSFALAVGLLADRIAAPVR